MWLPNVKTWLNEEGRRASLGSSKTGRRAPRRATRPWCEEMEGRQLLSGITATLNCTGNPAKGPLNVLQITGTSGNDDIELSQTANTVSVQGVMINWELPWETVSVPMVPTVYVVQVQISTGSGNDTVKIDPGTSIKTLVVAGNGTDSLITGGSNDTIFAGTGADTFVSIGGSHNYLFGGVGNSAPDSFWTDSGATLFDVSSYEQNNDMVHQINSFATLIAANGKGGFNFDTPTMSLNGQSILDPGITDEPDGVSGAKYENFANDPLFASGGPSPADIAQGSVGDCQFLSALLGIVSHNPQEIRQMIVSLGDGTYAVRFSPGGVNKYVRVNADLPVNASGGLVYAQLGQQNSLWVALMEKAWTFERPTGGTWWADYVGTYGNISGGGPGELFANMNIAVTNLPSSNVFSTIVSDVNAGLIVDVCTVSSPTSSSGLVGAHCYYVDHVNYTSRYIPFFGWIRLATSLTLRNPWGGSNTWVTVSWSDINANISSGIATTG